MPNVSTFSAVAGAMPAQTSSKFLPWTQTLRDRRRRQCVFKRATTFYIDPVNGDDNNTKTQAQSQATPWKTLTNVRKALTGDGTTIGGQAGFATPVTNTAFLFKRGTMIRDASGLEVSTDALHFGSYGPNVAGSDTKMVKPIISAFTIQWLNGVTVTTPGGATNRRQVSLTASATVLNPTNATTIGWFRFDRSATLAGFANIITWCDPFTYCSGTSVSAGQDATAYAKIEAQDLSFYCDSNGVVNVNFGNLLRTVADPNAISAGTCFEATPGVGSNNSAPDGLRIKNGASRLWVEGLCFEGFGCQSISYQNASGIRNGGGTEDVAYIANCESYYGGRHMISHEADDIATGNHQGGVHFVENCVVGYTSPSGGASCLNSFSAQGNHETYFVGNVIRFGCLPVDSTNTTLYAANTFTGPGQVDKVPAFYGHTGFPSGASNGTGGTPCFPVALYLNISNRIIDERDQYPNATVACEAWTFSDELRGQNAFLAGTENDPTTYKVIIIDWQSPRYRSVAQQPAMLAYSRTMFINTRHYIRPGYTTLYWWAGSTNAIWLNSIFEIDCEGAGTVSNLVQFCIFNQTTSTTIKPRLMNCEILVRGGDSTGYVAIANANFAEAGAWGIPMGNCIISNPDALLAGYSVGMKVCYGTGAFSANNLPVNSSNYLRYIGIYGAVGANPGGFPLVRGFDQATGFIDLSVANSDVFGLAYGADSLAGITQAANASFPLRTSIASDSPVAKVGNANPFSDVLTSLGMCKAPEYDFFGMARPGKPSLGPIDVMSSGRGGSDKGIIGPIVG
jgi:hypothetical protein